MRALVYRGPEVIEYAEVSEPPAPGPDDAPGLQAEYASVPHANVNLVPIPDGMSAEAAVVLTDNAPTAWYGCRRARVGPGE